MRSEKLALSAQEFANALGVHVNTVYKLTDLGQVRSFRLGKRLLIPRVELERLLAGAQKETTPRG